MPFIELNSVSVWYPIYSTRSRSLKNAMLSATTGGRIGNDANHLVVQALDRVSMKLNNGDRLALVGHNGAGKSTLLRILAGIYDPPQGSVKIDGRVTPMFDTTLGIDPESTGYENIILRGMYLGLSKADMIARQERIAAFSDLGAFLDLPVRTYSAGMQARLALAIATSLEPEILLLDEGISAGDAGFFQKANDEVDKLICRSAILVLASHSNELVQRLCNKVAVLEHGRLMWMGQVNEGLQYYNRSMMEQYQVVGVSVDAFPAP